MLINQRESQSKEILRLTNTFLETGLGLVVYVYGPPGAGKTFTLTEILRNDFPSFIYLNCSKILPKISIYEKLKQKINKKIKEKGINGLKLALQNNKSKIILLLDEIDLLITNKQTILYNLFNLPDLEKCSLLMFVVANTMNLSEITFESKIKSRMGNTKINFSAYTSDQLLKITDSGKELELASKRIAALGGDARKMIEVKNNADKLGSKPSVYQVNSLLTELYKPIYYIFMKNLTNYQKIIILSLMKTRKSTLINLFEDLLSLCNIIEIKEINYFEFKELINISHNQGLLELKNNAIKMFWNEDEIKKALFDDKIYKKLIKN